MSIVKLPRNKPFKRVWTYDYVSIDGKTLADIEEIVYSLQIRKSNDDAMYLLKRRTDGSIVVDDATKKITFSGVAADFANLTNDTEYTQIFGIKYTGDTIFTEYVLKDSSGQDEYIVTESNWLQITT